MAIAFFVGLGLGLFLGYRLGRWHGFYQLGASERRTRVLRAKGKGD